MELLQFILSSAWNFIGTVILLFILSANISNILKAFRLFEINHILKIDDKSTGRQGTTEYTKVWEDLTGAWKNKKSKDSSDLN